MKIFISGYGRMGRMVEKIVLAKQVEYAGWSENVTEVDRKLASECVCIDFTTPDAFRANYKFLAENFKAVVVGTTGRGGGVFREMRDNHDMGKQFLDWCECVLRSCRPAFKVARRGLGLQPVHR